MRPRRRFIAAALALLLGALGGGVPSAEAALPGDPLNDKIIFVRGFSKPELEEIGNTFARLYDVPPGFRVDEDKKNKTLSMTFPGDIDGDLFCYLVNYVRYPKNFDLRDRKVAVLGKTTLGPTFRQAPAAMHGRQARVFVPDGDKEFDMVLITIDPGVTYRYAFPENRWDEVKGFFRRPKSLWNLW